MFNPFRMPGAKVRARSARRVRKAQASALAGLMTAMAAPPPKPVKSPKPAKSTPKKLAAPKPSSAPRPKGVARAAGFSAGTHDGPHGQRAYRLYVPTAARKAGQPLPLLVMLHGCGQTPEDFARGTRMNALAEELGFLVLYPAQSSDAHRNRCWNWFRRGDQRREMGEPALLAGMVMQVLATHPQADPSRVYVAGMSAGASAALILAAAYPDIFAAVGAHSGLPAGAAHDAASALGAMQRGDPGHRAVAAMPTIIFHGAADAIVNPRNGRFIAIRALEPFSDLQKTVRTGRAGNGREYVRTAHRLGAGRSFAEHWAILGSGHGWSGGDRSGSFTDPAGPDASREMIRFFLRHRTTKKRRAAVPQV